MRINAPNKRKAISPVLATVILIAITLIAAIAIAGFVFGLFGSFTSSAQISAQVVSCGKGATDLQCNLNFRNSGTSNAAITAVSVQIAGVPAGTTCVGALPQTVPAGGALNGLVCTTTIANANEPAVGSMSIGSVTLSNGGSVPFSGVWS